MMTSFSGVSIERQHSAGQAAQCVLRVLAVLLAVSSGVASATTTADERPPCWRSEFEALTFLEGDWHVESAFRLGDGGVDESVATSCVSADFGGCMLVERFVGTRSGEPFEALGIFAYNMVAGRVQKGWIDAEHGMLVTYEGGSSKEGLRLGYSMSLRGMEVLLEHRYSEITNDGFLLESRRSRDGGSTWETTWTARYSRTGQPINGSAPSSTNNNDR